MSNKLNIIDGVACTQARVEHMAKGAELDRVIRQKLGGLGYEF